MKRSDLDKSIAQLLQENPQLNQVLFEFGLECADCLAAQVDTLKDLHRMYNIDLDKLLARLDQVTQSAQSGTQSGT